MATNYSYFSHDSNSRNDEKIIRVRMKHGAAGYGVFFMLLERLKEEEDYTCAVDYAALAFDFRADEELIKSVVEDFGLFEITDDGSRFFSRGFKERMAVKDEGRKAMSESGRRGAEKRWNKIATQSKSDSHPIATPLESDSHPIDTPTKTDSNKSKVNKIKIIPPHTPPTEGKEGGCGSFFNFMISLENRSRLIKALGKDVPPEDQNEALRLCSWANEEGREKSTAAVEEFMRWADKKSEPYYYAIQRLQACEQNGLIFPPKKDLWRIWCYIESLSKYDSKKIYELIQTEDHIEILKDCIKAAKNPAKKIQSPGRYIIQTLKNCQ